MISRMTNIQLYLTIGMPTLAVLVGILINGMQFSGQMGALSARMTSLETRMGHLENKFDVRFDMLISKLMDVDNRLTRLETRLERH